VAGPGELKESASFLKKEAKNFFSSGPRAFPPARYKFEKVFARFFQKAPLKPLRRFRTRRHR
jgi:hypothetical protein